MESQRSIEPRVVNFGGFTVDADRRLVFAGSGEMLHLTPKAFDLLTLLIAEAPRVVRKAELHERLWPGTFVADSALTSLVKELRRVLHDRDSASQIIRTAHGVGYAFCREPEPASPRHLREFWLLSADRRISLKEGVNQIGRDPASEVWLDAAGVSRHHARIAIGGEEAVIEDVGSKNGTMVGDKILSGPVRLHNGDRIRIGPVSLTYRASDSSATTETAVLGPGQYG